MRSRVSHLTHTILGMYQSTVTTCDVAWPRDIEIGDLRAIEVDEGLGIIFLEVQQEQETVLHCLMLV
jgi:hypothetical protein